MTKKKRFYRLGAAMLACGVFCVHADAVLATAGASKVEAADNAVQAQQSKRQLIEKVEKLQAFSCHFQQQVFGENGQQLQSASGKLAVSKPNKVYWHIEAPDESLIVSDGDALWLYDPFIEQVSIYSLTNATANTPILLLTNTDAESWQDYTVTMPDDGVYLIKANDSDSQVKSLELHFNGEQLQQFVILDATGQLSKVSLTGHKPLTADDEALFHFTAPQGVAVDDQR